MSEDARTTPPARRRRPVLDAVVMCALFALLLGALGAAFASLHREFWSASAFVERYVETIAAGDASGTLAIPGVAAESPDLEQIGRPLASEALLRSAVLTHDIADVHATSEIPKRGAEGADAVEVTVAYTIDGRPDESSYLVEQDGRSGLVPSWRFETSPLGVVDLVVRGSWQLTVNGFEIDKRQVSPDGVEADPLAPLSLLVFSPGVYDVAVDTAATVAAATPVRATGSLEIDELDLQTQPSEELTELVQTKVDEFLDECATQQVLQPAGCPFGETIEWGFAQPDVAWSIDDYPRTSLAPDGDDWRVAPARGTAHLAVTVQDLFTGQLLPHEAAVPFTLEARVDLLEGDQVHIEIDRVDG
ncbi:hypothetical protein [Microbacterium sp. gxy059]|uniref:hypothetical protein n=1 Tax=Microbacterium sp. gxy059 TaxID=2957199 RepID=UPI003D9596FD